MERERALHGRLGRWIAGDGSAFGSFDEAALAVFSHQFARNAPYRAYCGARGASPRTVRRWQEIPAVPTDAFKFPSHRLATFPPDQTAKRFLTSGTTREIRGIHEFDDLSLYELSVRHAWRELRMPAVSNPWFLSPRPADAPESSLVHMFGILAAETNGRWLIDATGTVDAAGLHAVAASGGAIQLFGTAIALLRFAEAHGPCPLPEGSWIFETGGYKGLADAPTPEEFRRRLSSCFAVPPEGILNEYSMTELSSQFYRWGGEGAHQGPHWTRIRAIDPETGAPAASDQPGYLEIVDLANLGSVCAIRTQDIAIARGESAFTLLGRDPGALPRGCSRASDDLLARS